MTIEKMELRVTPELMAAMSQILSDSNPFIAENKDAINELTKALQQPREEVEEIKPVVPETAEERMKRMAREYRQRIEAMLPKIEAAGWYYVGDGKYLPKINQEVLFVIDKRMTQSGDHKRAAPGTFKKTKLLQVKHGFVNDVGYESEIDMFWVEIRLLKVKSRTVDLINGSASDVVLWRPMLELPPMPKLTEKDYRYTE